MRTVRFSLLSLLTLTLVIGLFVFGCYNGGGDDDDDDDDDNYNGGNGTGGDDDDSNQEECGLVFALGEGIYSKTDGVWNDETPSSFPTAWTVNDLSMPLCDEGFAVGTNGNDNTGILLHKVENGWEEMVSNVPGENWDLFSVSMISPHKGFAVGANWAVGAGLILEYTNDHWGMISPPQVADSDDWWLTDVKMLDSDVAVAIGVDWDNRAPVILKYENEQWKPMLAPGIGGGYGLYAMDIPDGKNGLAVGFDFATHQGVVLSVINGEWLLGSVTDVVSNNWRFSGASVLGSESVLVGRNLESARGVIFHGVGQTFSPVVPNVDSNDWYLQSVLMVGEGMALACGMDVQNDAGLILGYAEDNWIVEARLDGKKLLKLRAF